MIDTLTAWWNAEDRAVSPVIGVILMVAITVILAAVIGTFVLDLGQNVGNTGPTASITVQDADASITQSDKPAQFAVAEHRSGDDLDVNNLKLTVRYNSNNTVVDTWEGGGWDDGTSTFGDIDLNGNSLTTSDTLTTGDVLVWDVQSGSDVKSGAKYQFQFVDTDTQNTVANVVVKIN